MVITFAGTPWIVAGLILVLAGPGWFPGAATVGWILLVLGLLPLVVFVLVFVAAVVYAYLGK